ncbi:unnamed protein product [Pseudo-nitzschia multistriata]|uniref:Uncharacterized protein n=1 Tax=Pseudo-nitzschia multistriata TaxID=183589 RepID=A0A448ZN86_9STRA|nr:unnamed protein product [Pseudo-nitzschia multistriata]
MNRLISILVLLMNSGVFVFARPSNDRCIDSITLVESEKVNGDNSNANYDYNNQGVCGPRSDRRAVWDFLRNKWWLPIVPQTRAINIRF